MPQFSSLLVFAKEFYCVSEFTFYDFIIKKFTLTGENLMDSSKSFKLHFYRAKKKKKKFNVLNTGFIAFDMAFSFCPLRI